MTPENESTEEIAKQEPIDDVHPEANDTDTSERDIRLTRREYMGRLLRGVVLTGVGSASLGGSLMWIGFVEDRIEDRIERACQSQGFPNCQGIDASLYENISVSSRENTPLFYVPAFCLGFPGLFGVVGGLSTILLTVKRRNRQTNLNKA